MKTLALGRRVEHDERSRRFGATRAGEQRSVSWAHHAPVLDQGDLGACTGYALTQALNTSFFVQSRPRRRYLTGSVAKSLYSLATQLDQWEGQWPPDDTGSSGLAVCKAGKTLGYLSAYTHAFGFDHFCRTLQTQPMIIGTSWYTTMFDPDEDGYVHPGGNVEGGHEYVALGVNYHTETITCLNSWSSAWGDRGRFRVRFDDFAALLADQGDATAPIGLS